jgi:uncharacterized membrane protein YgdD (TMEM256/DUF423 family)
MNVWLAVAAVNGALAVIAGAFAAHGLKAHLEPAMLAVFETGARYHLMHALALGLAAFALRETPRARISAWLFLAGIVLFCGSLYVLALTGVHALGLVTPFGGLAFIGGWLALAWAAVKMKA